MQQCRVRNKVDALVHRACTDPIQAYLHSSCSSNSKQPHTVRMWVLQWTRCAICMLAGIMRQVAISCSADAMLAPKMSSYGDNALVKLFGVLLTARTHSSGVCCQMSTHDVFVMRCSRLHWCHTVIFVGFFCKHHIHATHVHEFGHARVPPTSEALQAWLLVPPHHTIATDLDMLTRSPGLHKAQLPLGRRASAHTLPAGTMVEDKLRGANTTA